MIIHEGREVDSPSQGEADELIPAGLQKMLNVFLSGEKRNKHHKNRKSYTISVKQRKILTWYQRLSWLSVQIKKH